MSLLSSGEVLAGIGLLVLWVIALRLFRTRQAAVCPRFCVLAHRFSVVGCRRVILIAHGSGIV